ncbi:MAG: glycoside hydrolase family 88 protein, partial [Opitutaceae bacterium]|nr:glycoside hydrolase family 88 protein [Opitutaceae bacterium]
NIEVNHHDIGFLYTLSTVPAWKLTGDKTARATALHAADRLADRYKPAGRFIQAWWDLDNPKENRLIIDSLMNLPLLYWASRETQNPRYQQIAENHLATLLTCIIRPDDSTYHTYYFDPATGAPTHGTTHQGFSDDSCWSRGQAWGIYGLALARRRVSQTLALTLAQERVTGYFLKHLPPDHVCYWDLVFTSGPEPRDSSAAAITTCGLLETIAHLQPGLQRTRYEHAAHAILRSLINNYAATPAEDGLLLHGVYSKPHDSGVDECCNWGDYYYLEALVRLLKNWDPYW